MKYWICYIMMLIQASTYAQENEFKLIGPGLDIKPEYIPLSLHFKFIQEKKPSFILRYTQGEYIVEDHNILPKKAYTTSMKVSMLHQEQIKSLKIGYVLYKDITVHRLSYICFYGDYALIKDDLKLSISDQLNNTTIAQSSVTHHAFTGEVEFYKGKRFYDGHLCLGLSIFAGYLGKPTTMFTDIINQYEPVHKNYFPDRGWGYSPLFINCSLSISYAL